MFRLEDVCQARYYDNSVVMVRVFDSMGSFACSVRHLVTNSRNHHILFYFQILQVCTSWEDYLWAFYRVMVDVRVEQVDFLECYLRKSSLFWK